MADDLREAIAAAIEPYAWENRKTIPGHMYETFAAKRRESLRHADAILALLKERGMKVVGRDQLEQQANEVSIGFKYIWDEMPLYPGALETASDDRGHEVPRCGHRGIG